MCVFKFLVYTSITNLCLHLCVGSRIVNLGMNLLWYLDSISPQIYKASNSLCQKSSVAQMHFKATSTSLFSLYIGCCFVPSHPGLTASGFIAHIIIYCRMALKRQCLSSITYLPFVVCVVSTCAVHEICFAVFVIE